MLAKIKNTFLRRTAIVLLTPILAPLAILSDIVVAASKSVWANSKEWVNIVKSAW